MIYNRWGTEIEIVAYCGKHPPQGFSQDAACVLVKVKFLDDGSEGYQFARNLKADGGAAEVDKAVDAAAEIELPKNILTQAISVAS